MGEAPLGEPLPLENALALAIRGLVLRMRALAACFDGDFDVVLFALVRHLTPDRAPTFDA
jgi:hypothetical protein